VYRVTELTNFFRKVAICSIAFLCLWHIP